MNAEKAAKELLYKHGFNMFMTMHIIKYSEETGISIHDIIQKFKDNSIEPNYVAYISFNGYESFCKLVSAMEK